jgi:hypothetical protein
MTHLDPFELGKIQEQLAECGRLVRAEYEDEDLVMPGNNQCSCGNEIISYRERV